MQNTSKISLAMAVIGCALLLAGMVFAYMGG